MLIGLAENVAIDVGYRFKAIPNVDLDDPEICLGHYCYPPAEEFEAEDDFAQVGVTIGFQS